MGNTLDIETVYIVPARGSRWCWLVRVGASWLCSHSEYLSVAATRAGVRRWLRSLGLTATIAHRLPRNAEWQQSALQARSK